MSGHNDRPRLSLDGRRRLEGGGGGEDVLGKSSLSERRDRGEVHSCQVYGLGFRVQGLGFRV